MTEGGRWGKRGACDKLNQTNQTEENSTLADMMSIIGDMAPTSPTSAPGHVQVLNSPAVDPGGLVQLPHVAHFEKTFEDKGDVFLACGRAWIDAFGGGCAGGCSIGKIVKALPATFVYLDVKKTRLVRWMFKASA